MLQRAPMSFERRVGKLCALPSATMLGSKRLLPWLHWFKPGSGLLLWLSPKGETPGMFTLGVKLLYTALPGLHDQ